MNVIDAPQSFLWSDLARHPKDVGEALDQHGHVTVSRGSQVLRLAPDTSDPIVNVMSDLCRILTALIDLDKPDQVVAILAAAWPWTRALPTEDQLLLAKEAGEVGAMCESLDVWKPLLTVIADWRRTARAWADGASPLASLDELDESVAARPV